jgi:hypothetical protein
MVCGSHEGVRRLSGNEKDILRSRFHFDQCAAFCFQKVAVAQHRSARQEEGSFSSVGESRSKPALPPKIVWQHQLGETVQFSFGYFAIGVCFDP